MKLSDFEYDMVLDNIAIGCVDVAIIYHNKILLEKRQFNPIKGHWWIFGGRILNGENLKSTAQRGVYRELRLYIEDEQRFNQIGVFSLVWPTRRGLNQENGCHHILIAHSLSITDDEYDKLNNFVNNSRYKWFDLEKNEILFLPELNAVISKMLY